MSDEGTKIENLGKRVEVEPIQNLKNSQSDFIIKNEHPSARCGPVSVTHASEVPSKTEVSVTHCGHTNQIKPEHSVTDDVSRALLQRKQPLMELLYSEEGYVRRLRLVKDSYIPAVCPAQDGITSSVPSPETSSPGPVVPEDLAARWRIIWGNWLQLYEWHSTFFDKLKNVVESDPDLIPKLFIESRGSLRAIYFKYCENHRKAALIAEQYRDYFEELRIHIGDKEDVFSHLMQPVQRIMRYQLPITEIVKYTERACSPLLPMWKRTLEIMKEIPKDTQLILEAARIDGFPGVITALGNILLRGDLLVATTTYEQLMDVVSSYKSALQECVNGSSADNGANHAKLYPASQTIRAIPFNPTTHSENSAVALSPTINVSLPSPCVEGCGSTLEGTGLFTGSLKFVESRLFLFEQMLVVTEEVKPKRRMVTVDSFAQSTYQFKTAINVNKMRFEPHWYNCNLPGSQANSDAIAVDQLLCSGFTPDDLRFSILDQTQVKRVVYVIDPVTFSNRETWVVQLREIQQMKYDFLLALQDPKRFNTGIRDELWSKESVTHEDNDHSTESNKQLSFIPPSTGQHQRQKKWPSFTMKRPVRLGSNTTSVASKDLNTPKGLTVSRAPLPDRSEPHERPNCLSRSLSAERHHVSGLKYKAGKELDNYDINNSLSHRSCSQSANSSIKGNNQIVKCLAITISDDNDQVKGSVVKKKSVFANLFGRGKLKRNKNNNPSESLPPPSSAFDCTSKKANSHQIDIMTATSNNVGDFESRS